MDDKFLDVDFTKDPNYVFGDLGGTFADVGPCYEDSQPIVPESKWQEYCEKLDATGGGLDSLVTRIYNQGREGSCLANACSQAHEIKQAETFGKDKVVHLSAISLYKRIGRSPGSGAMVSDGLDEGSTRGILPLDNPENRGKFSNIVMPNTGWSEKFPTGWEQVAKLFRFDERFVLRSVEGLISALLSGHPVVVGRAGHSICYTRPMYKSGRLVVKYANSWGDWGDNGYGYDSMNLIRSSASWAFAVRSIIVPPGFGQ
jgi:hypothetical protein